MFKIVRRKEMANGTIILNEIEAPLIAKKTKPGQFVILKANETGERIPLTIADTNIQNGTISVIYMVVGKSTAIFKTLLEGDSYQDVTGPLGNPTNLKKLGKIICVGGGTGIAVLHPIAKGLKKIGNHIECIIGAKSKNLLILEDEMSAASNKLTICTDDGSYGHHGFVTDILENFLSKKDTKLIVAIGPVPMMKACSNLAKKFNSEILVSLNPIMIDGTGMCGGCRVSIKNEIKFACVDGPEFNGKHVDFDELMLRLQAYNEEEKKCYNNECTIKTQ